MEKKAGGTKRRETSLTRERIIEASIELLNANGEGGLTFRALSERLATGAGAIYWHVDDKNDLLTAASDAVVARALEAPFADPAPRAVIRTLALRLFDTIDTHPWVGAALTRAPGQLPMVRILEGLGQQVRALDVAGAAQWTAVSALLHYILGVAGQNAANTRLARAHGADRTDLLDTVAAMWSRLDPDTYPFTRSVAGLLSGHDDRGDFLAGIDLILLGLTARHAS